MAIERQVPSNFAQERLFGACGKSLRESQSGRDQVRAKRSARLKAAQPPADGQGGTDST